MHTRWIWLALLALAPSTTSAAGLTPKLTSPKGTIQSTAPTFSWTAVRDASSYHLWLLDQTGTRLAETVAASAVCAGSRCELETKTELGPGQYTWLVQTHVPTRPSLWAGPARFTVEDDVGAPSKIVLLAPEGAIETSTPALRWNEDPGGLDYEVSLTGGSPRIQYRESFRGGDACESGICEVPASTSGLVLGDGNYRWKVRASNGASTGRWSDVLRFEVKTSPEPPARPTLIAPWGRTPERAPRFTWNAAERATSYVLTLRGPADEAQEWTLEANEICAESECAITPKGLKLEDGRYQWTVTAHNAGGPSRPSARMRFRAGDFLGTPEPIAPVGSTSASPEFEWTEVEGAASYRLQIRGGDVDDRARFDAESICEEGTCSTKWSQPLREGDYVWRVTASGSKPRGNPSPWTAFTVKPGGLTPPGTPVLVAPAGTTTEPAPTFVWEAVDTATYYVLTVQDASSPVLYTKKYSSDQASCDETCEVTPGVVLSAGDYFFAVQAKNDAGAGPQSEFKKFTVAPNTPTGVGSPVLLAPLGTIATGLPRYEWRPVKDADSYVLELFDASNPTLYRYVYQASICGDTCGATPPEELENGEYSYTVTAKRGGLEGTPSKGRFVVETSATLPAPTLLAPTGIGNPPSPEFRWSEVAAATGYTLTVQTAAGALVFEQAYTPSLAGCAGECAVTPTLDLAAGSYEYRVTAEDGAGNVAASGLAPFSVSETNTDLQVFTHIDGDIVDDRSVLISGRVPSAATSLTAELEVDGVTTMVARGVAISPNDAWSVYLTSTELVAGQATLRLVATETGGVSSSLDLDLTVVPWDPKQAVLLSRATFGASPALLEELRSGGVVALQDRLLNPTPDATFQGLVAGLPTSSTNDLREYAVFHALFNPNELEEVMTQFWDNHFSTATYSHGMPGWELDENVQFRQNALGRFRDLLEISAKSPAMLHYLDGVSNVFGAPNENYSREVLELYTMGIDGGYTQDDVEELARILTGWSESGGSFVFNAADHDFDSKEFLGVFFPDGVGLAEGEQVLDMLSAHPSTADFICTKLVEMLISEDPDPTVVAGCASVFQTEHLNGNPNQIREVVSFLLDSPDFVDPLNFRAKVKTPLELLASTVRAVDGTVEDLADLERDLRSDLEMNLFHNGSPDGFSETADDWISSGLLLSRVNFVNEVARETASRDTYFDVRTYFVDKGLETAEGIIGYLFHLALADEFSATDMAIASDILSPGGASPFDINAPDAESRLRRLVGTVLSFPGFQHQ